jgi:hypothetical protein
VFLSWPRAHTKKTLSVANVAPSRGCGARCPVPWPASLRTAVGTHGLQTWRSMEVQQTNLDIYGAEPVPWSRALDQLQDVAARKSYWLATVRPDGRPHVAAVGALWLDGTFYFTSGAGTRKSRNLLTST